VASRAALVQHSSLTLAVDTQQTSNAIREFLAGCRNAVVIEGGEITFDLRDARYSVSGEHGKTLLHLWSPERNVVRRVLDCEQRREELVLTVQRFGQTRPAKLHLRDGDARRAPAARDTARAAYRALLRRALEREFSDYRLERLTSSPDLERSFGPVYARGVLRRGAARLAVLGVGAQEPQPSVDAALTFGLLWLDDQRQRGEGGHVEGLALVAPPRRSSVLQARMAWLTRSTGAFHLYELDERAGELREVDTADRGNIQTRLVQCPDEDAARERFTAAIARVRMMAPGAEAAVITGSEISFRLHGLEFARARMGCAAGSFRSAVEIVFGVGAEEASLTEETAPGLTELARRLAASRVAGNGPQDPLWRLAPERWLESLVVRDPARLDPRLDARFIYSQVPAFSASDRAMIDVLACTGDGRLAVLELKAGEDINLPLQGLDYWARVRWHQQSDEFRRFGYFRNRELSPEPPLLLLVAPALRIHPATDTLLRYLSPEIDWELIAVDERWREGLKVVFRKRAEQSVGVSSQRTQRTQGL
jgi:hypothetical protein